MAAENQPELLTNGRLKNLSDWNEDVARQLATHEGLTLTEGHWEIIKLMRDYYATYNIPPIRKLLIKEIRQNLGETKALAGYLDGLFPGDVLTQGTKIAGLPLPVLDAEIDRSFDAPKVIHAKPGDSTPKFHDFAYKGRTFKVHPAGNLADMDDWSEDLAWHMAEMEGIDLTPAHWEVIHYLRKFYFKYGISPMVRLLTKHLREELGPDHSDPEQLYKLFPGGPSRQGSRIAGLPEPQGCID